MLIYFFLSSYFKGSKTSTSYTWRNSHDSTPVTATGFEASRSRLYKFDKAGVYTVSVTANNSAGTASTSVTVKVEGQCTNNLCVLAKAQPANYLRKLKSSFYYLYLIYTFTLAMAEPWVSEVLFTMCELYFSQIGQPPKTVSVRISARVKCKHTPSASDFFCSYVLHVI